MAERRNFYRNLSNDPKKAVGDLLSTTPPPPGMEEVVGFLRNLFGYCSQVIGWATLNEMGVPSGATSRRAKHELEHIREACLQSPRPPRDFRTRELVEYARERIYEAEALADRIVLGALGMELGGRKTPGGERTRRATTMRDFSSCLFGEYSVWGAKTPVALFEDSALPRNHERLGSISPSHLPATGDEDPEKGYYGTSSSPPPGLCRFSADPANPCMSPSNHEGPVFMKRV